METDVKTKYIDITQLPVSEEPSLDIRFGVDVAPFYKSLMEAYGRVEREALIEGCWGDSPIKRFVESNVGITTRVFGVPSEYLNEDHRRMHDVAYNISAMCTPSRNSITGYYRSIKQEWVGE